MSKQYDDARFGVEKILQLPPFTISADVALTAIVLTEDITVTEFGYIVTTATSCPPALSIGAAIRDSAATLATLIIGPAITVIGNSKRQTSISTAASSKNETLTFVTIAGQTGQAGAIAPYIKYKERY